MGKMPSGGFGNPSIFPKNRLFCILSYNFQKNFQNFQKIFEKFFEKNFFWKKNFAKKNFRKKFFCKIFFEKKFWKIFLKIVDFLLKYWFFPWKSSIFPIFEAPSAPQKYPLGGFGASKKPLQVFEPPPLWTRPPTTSLHGTICQGFHPLPL